ncbi:MULTISPECIES: hypothetical protein [Pseudomonas]|uniref:hypothetical protein n=1 Tax=Pseudomonas TaxID=286 RepID=UPI000ACF7778|nr:MULTISPECIES: hypothetical protein [Pseudomonas]MDO4234204.1 hypothetical protein [Pseudomonas sp.]
MIQVTKKLTFNGQAQSAPTRKQINWKAVVCLLLPNNADASERLGAFVEAQRSSAARAE